jgi:hypothetical protein
VLALVLGGAARLIGVGIVVGLTLALAFAQAVGSFLVGVPPRDPATFAAVHHPGDHRGHRLHDAGAARRSS